MVFPRQQETDCLPLKMKSTSMLDINNTLLRKTFWFVLAASLLALAVSNYIVYPSFARMLISGTEKEAVMVGRHIARTIFPSDLRGDVELTPTGLVEISHAANEFDFHKLKIFSSDGTTIYSTDRHEIGQFNAKEYFRNVVARGYVQSKLVRKNSLSMEGEEMRTDVIETYIPVMRNGSFAGALEIYLDITEEISVLKNILIICNLLFIGSIGLFSLFILAVLVLVDRTLAERQRASTALQANNLLMNREIETRKQVQRENEQLIGELRASLMKVKLLRGFLPICSYCKKIRDDRGYWNQIESYIRDHSEAEFSHGMCPDCMKEHHSELHMLLRN